MAESVSRNDSLPDLTSLATTPLGGKSWREGRPTPVPTVRPRLPMMTTFPMLDVHDCINTIFRLNGALCSTVFSYCEGTVLLVSCHSRSLSSLTMCSQRSRGAGGAVCRSTVLCNQPSCFLARGQPNGAHSLVMNSPPYTDQAEIVVDTLHPCTYGLCQTVASWPLSCEHSENLRIHAGTGQRAVCSGGLYVVQEHRSTHGCLGRCTPAWSLGRALCSTSNRGLYVVQEHRSTHGCLGRCTPARIGGLL